MQDNLFHLLDTDHDGKVDETDFENAADRIGARCRATDAASLELRTRHRELFDRLYPPEPVTLERFHQTRPVPREAWARLAEAVVAVCDADGDGELDSVEFRAFLTGWGLRERDADMAFRRIDIDFSGTISRRELAETFEEFFTSDDPHTPGAWLFGPPAQRQTARIPYPTTEELPEETQRLLHALPPLNIFRMTAHAHTVFPAAITLSRALLAGMTLPGDLRELAVLQVATDLGATYVWTQHVSAAQAENVPRAKMIAIRDGRLDAPCLTETEQAALAFTAEVLRSGAATDSTFTRLHSLLSSRQIVELLIVTGFYTMISRISTALALDGDASQGDAVVGYATGTTQPGQPAGD